MSCCKHCATAERPARAGHGHSQPIRRTTMPQRGLGIESPGRQTAQTMTPTCKESCSDGPASDIHREPPSASPGRALDPAVRAFFEQHMGRDFGRVRLHDDGTASASAEVMGALAYTVGPDISFSASQYRPKDAAGLRLLAHELAHVVQQGAAGPGDAKPGRSAALPGGTSGDAFEMEADRVAAGVVKGGLATPALRRSVGVQMQARPSLLSDGPILRPPTIPPPPLVWPGSIRESWVIPMPSAPAELEVPPVPLPFWRRQAPSAPTLTLDPALRFTPVMILRVPRCVPDRPLTWADFPGNSPPGGFGAVTRYGVSQIVVDGNPMFQTNLRNTSAVLPKFRNPGQRQTNGCAGVVAQCRSFMLAHPNGTWTTGRPNPDTCPASVVSIDTATTADECGTVVGANCDAAAIAESARLLAHEQLHFDIACVLVGRADDALIAGTHTPAQLAAWLARTDNAQQNRYDRDSDHGCNAGGQAAWTASVAASLPAVALPP